MLTMVRCKAATALKTDHLPTDRNHARSGSPHRARSTRVEACGIDLPTSDGSFQVPRRRLVDDWQESSPAALQTCERWQRRMDRIALLSLGSIPSASPPEPPSDLPRRCTGALGPTASLRLASGSKDLPLLTSGAFRTKRHPWHQRGLAIVWSLDPYDDVESSTR